MLECQGYGQGWRLPKVYSGDMNLFKKAQKEKGWKSLWLALRKVTFDGLYWEDGTFQGF